MKLMPKTNANMEIKNLFRENITNPGIHLIQYGKFVYKCTTLSLEMHEHYGTVDI